MRRAGGSRWDGSVMSEVAAPVGFGRIFPHLPTWTGQEASLEDCTADDPFELLCHVGAATLLWKILGFFECLLARMQVESLTRPHRQAFVYRHAEPPRLGPNFWASLLEIRRNKEWKEWLSRAKCLTDNDVLTQQSQPFDAEVG
ncbi:hypothetical protein LIA77_08130 [Sarocladium implicatum]|nr:hypothetical protein LIA77_08130 [Sarocladium implicatum]